MSGLLNRIRRRRDAAPPAAPEPLLEPSPAEEVEAASPAPSDAHREPSGEPVPSGRFERPGFRARGELRRRLRYLRRLRELGLRDLGGLVFDLDRFGRSRDDLVRAKLDALTAIDAELVSVAAGLGDDARFDELREAGIAPCHECGALLASEARYCSACGVRVDRGNAAIATAFAVAAPTRDEPAAADAET